MERIDRVVNKKYCCGCGACAQACPTKCITMKYEKDGFIYPEISKACVGCGKCRKACPAINSNIDEKNNTEPKMYMCYHLDENERMRSMTGAVCYLLSKAIISEGGCVFGVVEDSLYEINHIKGTTLADIERMRRSKYLQSEIKECYKDTFQELKNGRLVLFTGTPCQIAGLYRFLGKDYSNLLTVDLVCHGVPSRMVFNKFISEKEKKMGKRIIAFYRDKSVIGGHHPTYTIQYEDSSKCHIEYKDNIYIHGFNQNLYQRESCLHCKFAKIPRVADISVGDLFVGEYMSEYDPMNKGLSMTVVSTEKGEQFFSKIKESLFIKELPISVGINKTEHLSKSPKYNILRTVYMCLIQYISFNKLTPIFTETLVSKVIRRIGWHIRRKE